MLGILSIQLFYRQHIKKFSQELYRQSAKQFGFRSGGTKTFCEGDKQKAIAG